VVLAVSVVVMVALTQFRTYTSGRVSGVYTGVAARLPINHIRWLMFSSFEFKSTHAFSLVHLSCQLISIVPVPLQASPTMPDTDYGSGYQLVNGIKAHIRASYLIAFGARRLLLGVKFRGRGM
jgi:hypothetical protein